MDKLTRFTSRAGYYARHRPKYPEGVIQVLRERAGWRPDAKVADIGAGTGISSELFLRHGNQVYAVEPNAEMRAEAEGLKARFPALEVLDGTAEHTGLPDAFVDFVVAATAFHWFDPELSRFEFRRILKPAGRIVLLWNRRKAETSPFLSGYNKLLLEHGTDYKDRWVKDRDNLSDSASKFFAPDQFEYHRLDNSQSFDLEGLKERLLSSSYAPLPGHAHYAPMMAGLEDLFRRFEQHGQVVMEYDTIVFF